MKDYCAPDWWYEPPVEMTSEERDALDAWAESRAEDLERAEQEFFYDVD